MEGTNFSKLLRKQIVELMDLNETLVARIEQLKSYILRSGFELPAIEAGLAAPIVENISYAEDRGSKRQRTGVSGSYVGNRHTQDSIPWEMLENSIIHSVREIISSQGTLSADNSHRCVSRKAQETTREAPNDTFNEVSQSSHNFERYYQDPEPSRALTSVPQAQIKPSERSIGELETSQVNGSSKQPRTPPSRSFNESRRFLRQNSLGPVNPASSKKPLTSFDEFSAEEPKHVENEQASSYNQSKSSLGHLIDEPNEEPGIETCETSRNVQGEDTLDGALHNNSEEFMETETDPNRTEEQSGMTSATTAEFSHVKDLEESQRDEQNQEEVRPSEEALQYEPEEPQAGEDHHEGLETEGPIIVEQASRRESETLPPLEEERTSRRTSAKRGRFSELVASTAQKDPLQPREERPKLYGRYSEPTKPQAKSASRISGTPIRPRQMRHSEQIAITSMPPVPSSILRAFDKIHDPQSPIQELKPASPANASRGSSGTGRFVPRMLTPAVPGTPQNPPNQSNVSNQSNIPTQSNVLNQSQSHTGPIGTSTPAPAVKSRTPRESLTEGSSIYQSALSSFGDRENASFSRSVSFKLPKTDNTSTDTVTPCGTPPRLPRLPRTSEQTERPSEKSPRQEQRPPRRRVLNSRNVYQFDDSQASLPDMSEMRVNPGDISEVGGRPKSLSQK